MIIKEKGIYRIITVNAYNGVFPITAYMVQRLEQRRYFPDKWVDVKGYQDRKKAEALFETLTD